VMTPRHPDQSKCPAPTERLRLIGARRRAKEWRSRLRALGARQMQGMPVCTVLGCGVLCVGFKMQAVGFDTCGRVLLDKNALSLFGVF
jgi:hypothetical protein